MPATYFANERCPVCDRSHLVVVEGTHTSEVRCPICDFTMEEAKAKDKGFDIKKKV